MTLSVDSSSDAGRQPGLLPRLWRAAAGLACAVRAKPVRAGWRGLVDGLLGRCQRSACKGGAPAQRSRAWAAAPSSDAPPSAAWAVAVRRRSRRRGSGLRPPRRPRPGAGRFPSSRARAPGGWSRRAAGGGAASASRRRRAAGVRPGSSRSLTTPRRRRARGGSARPGHRVGQHELACDLGDAGEQALGCVEIFEQREGCSRIVAAERRRAASAPGPGAPCRAAKRNRSTGT